MNTWHMIIGVLLFALAGAILYVWGLKKSFSQKEDMTRSLISVCGSRAVKYLKKHDTISREELEGLIKGVTVHPAWSRKKLTVTDPKIFAPQVIDFLLDQQYIQEAAPDTYRRKL